LAKRYINRETSSFYKASSGRSRSYVLIFGDEVKTVGIEENNREKVVFRKREGWVEKEHLGTEPVLEFYFIDVGQGDSIYIVTPGQKKILVDGGMNDQSGSRPTSRALRFLAWKYRLSEVDPRNPIVIDLLVLTHADKDHIKGLIPIIDNRKIEVREIIHSGIATFKENAYDEELGDLIGDRDKFLVTRHNTLDELDDDVLSDTFLDWKRAIKNKGGIHYHAVYSSGPQVDVGDPRISLEVLGPRLEKTGDNKLVYRWLGDTPHTINGHSVVIRLTYGAFSFLLPGDLNKRGAEYLMEDQTLVGKMDAHVLKAPHHGSHEYYRKWLNAVNPQITVISSGDDPDHGHPRANFIGGAGNASRSKEPLIFSTEIASMFKDIDDDLRDIDLSEDELKALDDDTLGKLRLLFKRRLHGMINVRTDGRRIYAARRVDAPYAWESYGDMEPASRSIPR